MRTAAFGLHGLGTRLMHFSASIKTWLQNRALLSILLLAFIQGLVCVALIPPWWHYDEPGHFEYVWLAAHSPTWPVAGQYDQAMRRELAVSLQRYGWYSIRNTKPDLNSSEPIPIGVPQVGDQPGYYFLAALPLRLIPNADVTTQYSVVRAFSFLLFLLIIVVVWYALGEILPGEHPLRWITTVFIALLPAFTDTMISVNNDVSAVLAASLALWACLRLINKGYTVGNILFLLVSLGTCYLSKGTAWFAFVIAPVALILALLRGRHALYLWAAAALVLIALLLATLAWGDPRGWYAGAIQDYPLRGTVASAPLGSHAFQFDDSGESGASQMLQIMVPEQLKALRGKTVTLGTWAWADHPTQAGPIFINIVTRGGETISSPLLLADATAQPTFHQVVFSVPTDAVYATLYARQTPHPGDPNNVYLDGLVLAPGDFKAGSPHFTDATAAHGDWNGHPFDNVVRNGSAEQGSLQLRKWADDKTVNFFGHAGISLSLAITTLQDWQGTGWYYLGAAETLFRTFWASLAGDKAFLLSSNVSYFLLLLTLAGIVGALLHIWRERRHLRWDLVGFLGIALLVPWLLSLMRGSTDFLRGDPLFPWARYAYPAILPTALLLCVGWIEWMRLVPGSRITTPAAQRTLFLSLMLGISIFAFMNAIEVLHPNWQHGWLSLVVLFVFQYAIFRSIARRPPEPAA